MAGFQSLNALRCQAVQCKKEMEATRSQIERRAITDRYMRKLKLLGFTKSDLLYEIYLMRSDI